MKKTLIIYVSHEIKADYAGNGIYFHPSEIMAGFTVSHESGLAVAYYDTKAEAKEAATRVAQMRDWSGLSQWDARDWGKDNQTDVKTALGVTKRSLN